MENKLLAAIGRTFTVTNRYDGHAWISDEPAERGGDNLGPTPIGLFLSSVASCRLITVQMYSRHKEWDLQGISISLELIPLEDGHAIEQEIRFEGDLSEAQKERLTVISHRCPVSKLIMNKIENRDK
jgi:putative redox protein